MHAVVDADQLVGLAGQRHEVVGHRHDGQAQVADELAEQRVKLVLGGEVQPHRGLVEHKQAGAGAQRLGQHDPALLAAGQAPHGAVPAVQHAHQRQAVVHPLPVLPAGEPHEPQVLQPSHHHHVADGGRKVVGDALALRHVADGMGAVAAGRAAEHFHAAAHDGHEAEDRAQQRCLARSVGAHDAHEPALVHVEVDVVQDAAAAQLHRHPADAYHDSVAVFGQFRPPIACAKARALNSISFS